MIDVTNILNNNGSPMTTKTGFNSLSPNVGGERRKTLRGSAARSIQASMVQDYNEHRSLERSHGSTLSISFRLPNKDGTLNEPIVIARSSSVMRKGKPQEDPDLVNE